MFILINMLRILLWKLSTKYFRDGYLYQGRLLAHVCISSTIHSLRHVDQYTALHQSFFYIWLYNDKNKTEMFISLKENYRNSLCFSFKSSNMVIVVPQVCWEKEQIECSNGHSLVSCIRYVQ